MQTTTNNAKKYSLTIQFIGGILEGLTHTSKTNVRFDVGWVCEKPIGRSPYKVIDCSEILK